jgi:60 kDa SS-A/Ro ribonucleoprotein
MPDALTAINLRNTPQTQPANERQVQNNAGGYTFTGAPIERLRRFLVLGTDGGTYYTSQAELTQQNATVVLDWARNRCTELVDELVTISQAGRAPRQNATLFALAAACSLGDDAGRKAALNALPLVARTGTHLFLFARYVEQFRGWGRGLRRAVADWYTTRPVDQVAYQAVKYRQREGWSHRDMLRLAHPATVETDRKALFDWICGRDTDGLPAIVTAFEQAQATNKTPEWLRLIETVPGMTWEMLPDAALNSPAVWEALLGQGVPQTALIRQLPRLTRLGLLNPMSQTLAAVTAQLADAEKIRKARLHPVNVLIAGRTYAAGESARGSGTWKPSAQVVDALDSAFYTAFGAIEPTNKRTMLALDVSGSMAMTPISGLPITPREASAALALVTAAVEPLHTIVGFTSGRRNDGFYMNGARMGQINGLHPLAISPRQRLNDAIAAVSNLEFGGTDCSLPMLWALQNKIPVDTFVVYTDNETYTGSSHPHQALARYRQAMSIDARMVVVGMTATDFTIADPNDPGMLDVAGFDSAVPSLISDFSARAI